MQRITNNQLESLVTYINTLTGSPQTPYTRDEQGSLKANVGNFHLYFAYGGVNVHRMSNESGGVNTPICSGCTTKRELFEKMHSFIRGLEFNKHKEA